MVQAAFTFVLGYVLERNVDLISIGTVVADRDGVEWTLWLGVELDCLLCLCECLHLVLVIDPVQRGSWGR